MKNWTCCIGCLVLMGGLLLTLTPEDVTGAPAQETAKLDFNRDVRAILSDKCFKCHGPDPKTQEASLRLDHADGARKGGKSGKPAIVPGDASSSELVRRIFSEDPDVRMPPAETKNPLTDEQKQILKRWIDLGAEYKPHWAFIAPERPKVPLVGNPAWTRNAIDSFVLAKLDEQGLQPTESADRYTLIRRVYLDLLGYPPTPAEADAFVSDPSPDAYEKLVDRLLDSPAYGQRWARQWLDLARYADTNGYEKDKPRSMWPWRDWVVDALNAGMPFDEFTIEQIAGDLLPNATQDQLIATGFHRNTMINEEGGIDPNEYRFYAQVDRVGTTGTTWLGLTVACSQCHTHKYDPLMHDEFYGQLAFFDQADEVEYDVRTPEISNRRSDLQRQVTEIQADLFNRFPLPDPDNWQPLALVGTAQSAGGATLQQQADQSILASGPVRDRDTYTLTLDTSAKNVTKLRLEALTDGSLPNGGPGRAPNGNFVLTNLIVTAAPLNAPDQAQPVAFAKVEADFTQDGFSPEHIIDSHPKTGWAIANGGGPTNVSRTAVFTLAEPIALESGVRFTITMDHQHDAVQHLLGHFRFSVSVPATQADDRPDNVRKREYLQKQFGAWLSQVSADAVPWTIVRPQAVHCDGDMSYFDLLADGSVLASGDPQKFDVYDVKLHSPLKRITAVRIEALPHESLPENGPGRVSYEGPRGDFFLTEVKLNADGTPVKFSQAGQDFPAGGSVAAGAIDDKVDTGWSVAGAVGQPHRAVFVLEQPIESASVLDLKMIFERYYAAPLGRFRVSVTDQPMDKAKVGLPAEIEQLAAKSPDSRSAYENGRLMSYFLSIAPELSKAHDRISKLEKQMPAYPRTLVMIPRESDRYRVTRRHHRGEYLKAEESVPAKVPAVLHELPADADLDRLTYAQWLVDEKNPLVARVVMNRHWELIFGRGIVKTTEDFGVQSPPPSHPELLDYLATEFMRTGWSMKRMHRVIVTSATYRQSSNVREELLEKDPENVWLARGPRVRLAGELIRDSALRSAGMLMSKMGGPGVFPPQDPEITLNNYGPLRWNVSQGTDRYRRSLYTFHKRTAPFAMYNLFGSPSGEACVARRERANTPMQALTLLNNDITWNALRPWATA